MAVALPEILHLGGSNKLSSCFLLLLLKLFLDGAESVPNSVEIENHLELGKQFLARKQYSDALSHYHAAVEGDPTNYLTLYKRCTAYLGMGNTRLALHDLNKVLELKPDFTAARLQRGKIFMHNGEYYEADKDFSAVLEVESNNEESAEKRSLIGPAIKQWELAQNLMKNGDHANAIQMLTQLLKISPWSVTFRQSRAEAYIEVGDISAAISDLRSVNKLTQDNTEGYYRISKLLYGLGDAINALKEVKECLKLDPEHKTCHKFYKVVKKVDAGLSAAEKYRDENKYRECIESAELVLKHEKEELMIIFEAKRLLCTCYMRDEQYTKSLSYCNDALNINPDGHIYCDRAESYLGSEMYDDAIHDYNEALRIDEHLKRARDGLEKAKTIQKQSERRDYYKILGVKRTASKQEITKAYRKAAQKWHPDNFRGDEKKIAEKKFIDIAAAKEVLTDPEKRKQFDRGEDPLDPESQNGQYSRGGNPFQHFQHGSPFQFKFHFN